ncbi:DUF3043 domain-containing protein [Nocardioides bruguierae]|uniref:DUF3043 domain-containing protein n=1 Tax=Nocardioides bruguierae TaxID=2945102 RepID=A0A9X2DAM4_9ACTN|nr:DUF3043 domain-containing protein [Nocardioides bruguierae]MCL8027078.1 DUF3043 domain-containing protein [Nocardioides bruguierae]MCM0622216.1 DUF3043 domain-containing protein [Nocardioides bruguierae]
MFGRSKSETETPATEAEVKPGGKGRPTPSRKDAQAASRARAMGATAPGDKKAARAARAESQSKMREAMRTGDERYLPAKDKGPSRRFIRDYIDARFSVVEILLPLLVVSIVLTYSGVSNLVLFANTLVMVSLLVGVLDMVLMRFRLRKQLTTRFPGDAGVLRGATWYAVTRAMQVRFLRLPKPQVKLGQPLPDTYR